MSYFERPKKGARWLKVIAIILLLAIVGTSEYFINEYKKSQRAELKRNASELAVQLTSQLETELHGATFLTHGIEAYVIARNGDIVSQEISSMLEQVYQFSPFFRNIGIAPDNTLFWIMPIEGNEAALGLRYEELSQQWPSIKRIIESRQPQLNGPLKLVQGGLGLIYRSPVYLKDKYWGMISAVIDANRLFESLDFAIEQSKLSARLGIRHVKTTQSGEDNIFLGNEAVFAQATATAEADIPHGKWQVAVAADDVKFNLWPIRFVIWSLALIGMLGAYYITRHFYQQQLLSTLSTEVQARTKDLRQVNSKLNHVLNAATETAIIATDKQGLITLFNRGAELMLGYKASEVIGRETPAIFHEPAEMTKKAEMLSAQFGRDISGFEVFTAIPDIEGSDKDDWTYVTKSGSSIPVELIVTKEFNDEGGAIGYLGLASDISQHVNDQRALHELKERLESATKVANIGVWELDLSTHKMLINEQMYLLTGLSPEAFDGSYQTVAPVFYKDDRDAFNEVLTKLNRRVLDSEPFVDTPAPIETTFRIVRADNSELRWMKGHAIIQVDESGVPQSMLGAMHEISSLVFAKEAAEKAEQLKSQFLSTVSHELRTPLSVISGAISLLSIEQSKLSEDTQSVLRLAERNSKRLTLLINDLLDIEKLTSGDLTLRLNTYSINKLVVNAIEENTGYAEQHNVSIRLVNRLSSDRLLSIDSLRFTQAMTNLISNAAKFSPSGGEIKVIISSLKHDVLVEVIDEGAGIPVEFKSRVFEPFAQAESSDSRNKGGTGLGLAITKTIIEKMGGSIGFESEPHQSTRFWFSLPEVDVVDTEKSLEKRPLSKRLLPLQTERADLKNDIKRVLHIEDYHDFSTVVNAILRGSYDVDTASSLKETEQKLSSKKYDIIVLDILLPDGSGWDVLELIKTTNQTVKVIVTSEHEVSLEKAEYVDAVLDKANFSQSKFLELINELAIDKYKRSKRG
jgi:PAS domain S-box-containing protein